MYSMALQERISHEKICSHFNIHFEKKVPCKFDHDESKTKTFQVNSNDKADNF